MLKLIQQKYEFSDYQIAVLKFFLLRFSAEVSKLLIIGALFIDNIPLYLFAIVLLQLLRSSSGGLHCKTYWGCFLLSLIFMILAIEFLPQYRISKFFQLIILLVCIMLSHYIGPVTSDLHPVLSQEICEKLKLKNFFVIFIFSVFLFIVPDNQYLTTGFWVIILNTIQLVLAKIFKKEVSQ